MLEVPSLAIHIFSYRVSAVEGKVGYLIQREIIFVPGDRAGRHVLTAGAIAA